MMQNIRADHLPESAPKGITILMAFGAILLTVPTALYVAAIRNVAPMPYVGVGVLLPVAYPLLPTSVHNRVHRALKLMR
jgi:hypothetical protein